MFSRKSIAVDIGNSNIKILSGSRKKIDFCGYMKTPSESVEDNRIVKPDVLFNSLDTFIREHRISGSDILFAIHGQDIVVRHIELPIMDEKTLRKSVEWEINQYLPENGANHYVDFKILDREITKEKKSYKILVVAVPKEKVDSYVILAEMLKLKLRAIDISSNCVSRVFENMFRNENKNRSIGILDIGSQNSSITILDGGKLFMEREVLFGMDNLTREVSRFKGTTSEESMQYLVNMLDFNKISDEDECSQRIQKLFDNVLSSFLKVVQFYSTGRTQKTLDDIYVIGGGSQLHGIREHIKEHFECPVHIMDNPDIIGCKINFPSQRDFRFHLNTFGLLLRKE